ncbi:MAG: winged helix-turn-helix transcriptional regulator, partial [Clostridium sp.]|nr:winged helix-turn-helix transcriptional regulator [Clostridium sp.]
KIAPIEKQKSFILYGVFLDLFKQIEKEDSISVDSIEDQMNALGDSKRLKIFSLLLDKEYYLKELADSLDLTSSTVSHHMDILSSAGLLKLRSKGKRIYYSINPEQTKLISDFFKKVTNKLGEKDYDNKRTTAKK